MADNTPSPSFEHLPDPQRPIVIESYCCLCSRFIGASSDPCFLLRAELNHACSEWMKLYRE